MKILIIDDDMNKIQNLKPFLKNHDVVVCKSYNKGMRTLLNGGFDGLILDMSFPIFDNGQIKLNQGLFILSEIERYELNIPVLVYSSEKTDVSKYNFVYDYVLNDNSSIKNNLENFILFCEKNINIERTINMDFKVNFNEYVKVKLTPIGIKALKDEHEQIREKLIYYSGKDIGDFALEVDDDGYSKFQFWILMKKFGHLMESGLEIPFESQIIITNGEPLNN